MITNICLLFEILSIVFCLHHLYGEKVTLDIKTVSFLSIYMVIMTSINYYRLPQTYTMIIYPIIIGYCGIKFGFKLKQLIVNNILNAAFNSSIQFVVLFLFCLIFKIQVLDSISILVVNGLVFMVIVFLLPKFRIYKLSTFLQDKDRIYIVALCISVIAAGYSLLQYKRLDSVGLFQNKAKQK